MEYKELTIQAAFNLNRPLKRPKHGVWRVSTHTWLCDENDYTNVLHLTVEDILATDWEVKEEPSKTARLEKLEKDLADLEQSRENADNVIHETRKSLHDLAARVSKLERGELAEK